MDNENTLAIVRYSRSLSFPEIPEPAIAAAKVIFLDTLGAMFAAWPTRHMATRILGDYVQELGGAPQCTILGRSFKAPAPNAALVNGLMGYAADIEGGGISRQHAAAVIVPSALVMAEWLGASGPEMLTSMVVAYDVVDRVGEANATIESYPHSFHPSAVFGTFGAAAVAGRLLGLDEDQFINAYGLAGNIAGGLMAWVNDPTEHSRSYGIGVAARNGVTAAIIASRGFGGPRSIFDDSKYNIYDAYSGAMNLGEINRGLGEDFAIARHLGFKIYPCCGDIHSGLDALLKILSDHNIATDQITAITHQVKESRRPVIDNNPLRSHNAQYIMAVAAVERRIQWDDFLRDRRSEPEIGRMFDRVRLIGSDALASSPCPAPAIVDVEVAGGRTYSERVEAAKGHSANPMGLEELEQKFMTYAEPVVGEIRARRIKEMVGDLENLTDVRDLMAQIAPVSTKAKTKGL